MNVRRPGPIDKDFLEIQDLYLQKEPTGKVKITKVYNLPCDYILHTVGPIIYGKLTKKEENLLEDCYVSCLKLAKECNIKSIAFCCISTGEFHFPNDKAAKNPKAIIACINKG